MLEQVHLYPQVCPCLCLCLSVSVCVWQEKASADAALERASFFFPPIFSIFRLCSLIFFSRQEKASADAALERAYLQIESLKESMAARKSRHAAEVFT